ncbi:MAG TPA: alkaline phosphatase family protein [Candidatus Binatia bacterium]|jgi:predicted AlkP superfamily phosphohydrolase/phosphomutase
MIPHRRSAVSILLTALAVLFCAVPRLALAQSATKAIVLAWDGAVPAFVRDMVRAGKLPNLATLIESGAFADDVTPSFPSKTAPGFASLMTGAPPRVTGISGNRVPRGPRAEFTILDSVAGFAEAPLGAEPIWSVAERAGKKAVVSHIPAFAGERAERAVRFSGYTLTAGRDGIVTRRAVQSDPATEWADAPLSDAPPIEIAFAVGETRFHGLFIDDPRDSQTGYDTLLLATARDTREIKAKLKPAPPSAGGELFWSEPIAVKSTGRHDAKVYFRLFDLKPDGGDFFLYYTRPARELIVPEAEVPAGATVRAFIGNGASFLYNQGAFGRTLPNGGSGSAEARYLETVAMAQHQLMETNRWAMENLPWDLYLAYTPFPDEAEHLWRGYLDPTLPNYRQTIADQLRPFLERVYQTSDEHLGLLLSKRPANSIFALISDHGMEGINKRVALNRALQQGGLLTLDGQGRVDLSKTQMLYPAVNNGYLLINTTDRKNGIVAPDERPAVIGKARDVLAAIRDGERAVVKTIYDAETERTAMGIGGDVGGDLYIVLAPGYDFDPRMGAGPLITEAEPYGNHGAGPTEPSMHTLMVLNGPGIRAGQKLAGVRIIDFAPTLAWLLHWPAPNDATGRILYEAFDVPK